MFHSRERSAVLKLAKVGQLSQEYIWTTQEGERIPLSKMNTRHLFNAMKMMFNHLAEKHRGEPVWFQQHYSEAALAAEYAPREVARCVLVMLAELERRTDLPAKYVVPLQHIRNQVYGTDEMLKGREPKQLLVGAPF